MTHGLKGLLPVIICVAVFTGTSSRGVAASIQLDEPAFFRDVERPQVKARQRLGGWLGNAEGLLWKSALEVLSDKTADKLATADNCEMAMWVAARNEGLRQSLDRAFLPLIDTLMTGGLSPALSAFSVPGKIVIAETLAFAVRLFNQRNFGVLDTKNIPKEVVRTLLNITAGYTAPLLVDDYLAGKITETALGTSLNKIIEKEHLVVSRAEASNLASRNFSPKQGLPLVKVNVVLVYSPYTHFVTIFVRGVGEGCPGNRLFVFQYEVDKDGLLVKNTVKERPVINLESRSPQLDLTDRKPAPNTVGPSVHRPETIELCQPGKDFRLQPGQSITLIIPNRYNCSGMDYEVAEGQIRETAYYPSGAVQRYTLDLLSSLKHDHPERPSKLQWEALTYAHIITAPLGQGPYKRAKEQAEKKKEAADEKAARQRNQNEFVRKYGVQELVEPGELFANPFLYQGKNVAVILSFQRMITANSAIFRSGNSLFIVSNIPVGTYKKSLGGHDLLAVRVIGMTGQVPNLGFLGVYFCQKYSCSDIVEYENR